MKNCLNTLWICLPELPRLTFCDISVAYAGKVHSLFLSLTKLELVKKFLNVLLYVLELIDCLIVNILKLTHSRNNTLEILLCELKRTVHEVTVDSHKLRVVALLEVLPSEVVILCLRGICRKNIAENVLLSREVNEILVEPYSPVA